MTARPDHTGGGTIFCDVKTPNGTCKTEFESLPGEEYYLCLARALDAGWKTRIWAHACPAHAGLWGGESHGLQSKST